MACCDCSANFVSHKAFVDHVINAHRVGGLVHRDFNDIGEYEVTLLSDICKATEFPKQKFFLFALMAFICSKGINELFKEWFNSVQEVFSVAYVKRMGIKQGNDYQVRELSGCFGFVTTLM